MEYSVQFSTGEFVSASKFDDLKKGFIPGMHTFDSLVEMSLG